MFNLFIHFTSPSLRRERTKWRGMCQDFGCDRTAWQRAAFLRRQEDQRNFWVSGFPVYWKPILKLLAHFHILCMYACICIIYIYIYAPGPATPPSPHPPWDGSHILAPYEIFPLPPLWCGGGVALSPSPVVWWGCGMVCWVCMVCMVGLVWHVWKVWYVWYVW